MEVFKRAIMQPGPPERFALQTVQEVIKPQKQTKLAQDENQFLENILRMLLQEYVSSAVQSGEKIMEFGQSIDSSETTQGLIPRLLDIVLYLCEKEHIEGGMIFSLLEDLTEMSTMKNCKDIFGYIESKQDILGKQELFARGKLVMLRTCNQLLRRLSKANDVVFSLNIKGVFNTSNETKYEKEPLEGICIDFKFYETFWGLQEYFSNPTITHSPAKWQKFASSLSVVLNTFEAQPLSDEEGDANNLEEEAVNFSIKYLTSSKLMGLELKDPSFRRHILVQCLILFDYLKAPGKGDKDLPSESMKDEISSCEARVKRLLELTPPKGKEFLQKIEHILEREKNWVWWKRDGCLPYEKQPIEKKATQDGPKKRKPRWRLGNKELSQLWKWADQNPNALTDPQRVQTPSIMDYWKPLAEDMDPSAGIEAEYHHKNNRVYCWKGLRLSARQDLEGFSKFTDHGVEGVVPLELLPPDVRSKYQNKPNERGKRSKKEEAKGTAHQVDENQMSTPATEVDVEGIRTDMTATSMEFDAASIPGAQGETPTPEELQKQSSDTDGGQEPGQLDADAEVEAGIIDGETDADVDLDAKDD
ncbi:suppressor of the transcriptional defect of hpr1 by overexpression [Stylosanthes scabra]|uniref:Suppressor of the transcriptional defect of hpr1 by overexpression n=1 Tax=Stylosanthes scabra TaxID=79078 RepID=A0ABU6VBQ5_9FABA|nr:suppressor of the transcriptional defect of hpr1 by overexpression [Stylosanthes scabra]